jgi:hypothetical protein
VAQDVFFQGLSAPLRLVNADAVARLLPDIMTGWPWAKHSSDPARQPFFSITGQPGSDRFLCENHVEPAPPRLFDAVNAACDAVAALAQALPAERTQLLCLHAAGVVVSGQLLVFPNVRRAGKSTLSAALAMAGSPVFSDDVLPLFLNEAGAICGLAMGIAPRLRLPLLDAVGQDFRDWVTVTPGPQNRQYKYLALAGQPAHGDSLPVASFVILDRQEDPIAAQLTQVPPDMAMDALLHQNFTRDRHSGDVLQVMADLLAVRPVLRLTYADLEDAVDCLAKGFARTTLAPPPAMTPAFRFRPAPVEAVPPALVADAPVRQRPDVTARTIGEVLYLADPEGRAIHRMDRLAAAIWDLLEAPAQPDEIEDLLVKAFPATDRSRIAADLRDLLAALAAWALLET